MSQQQKQAGPSAPHLSVDAQNRRDKDECIVDIPPSPVNTEEESEPDETDDAGEGDGHAEGKGEAKYRWQWSAIWKKCPKYLAYMLPLSLCLLVPILVGLFAAPDATIGASDNTRGVRIVWFFTWVSWAFFFLWLRGL